MALLEAEEQLSVGAEHVDVAESGARDIVFGILVLFRVRHVDVPSDALNVERREAFPDLLVAEHVARDLDWPERRVEHLDVSAPEIRDQQVFLAADFSDCRALVDRVVTGPRVVRGRKLDDRLIGVDAGIPA